MYPEDLEFVNEMVKVFAADPTVLYRFNEDMDLVAFRWGLGNDCIKVMRLDREVAFIHNCVPSFKLKTTVIGKGE